MELMDPFSGIFLFLIKIWTPHLFFRVELNGDPVFRGALTQAKQMGPDSQV